MSSPPTPGSPLSPLYYLFTASRQAWALLDEAMDGSPLRAEEYATYGAVLDLQPVTPTELARHLSLPTTTALDAVPRDGRRRSRHTGFGTRGTSARTCWS